MLGLNPGTNFGGRYEVLKYLGAGGMGAVYLACDLRAREFIVALKVLYPGVIKTAEARERFRNEIMAAYRVDHKNIVRAYEYFELQEVQAYAMEYVSGGDLLARMKDGPMKAREVASLLKQIAAGLQAIHQEGIVHRDLKPENILITSDGVAKISDFGVARLRGSNTLTQDGAMVGTPKYLCPEYIETGSCDSRGDIYALGVIGYEMVAGRSPFKSETVNSMMMERFDSSWPKLSELSYDCPRPLIAIIEKAMSLNVNQRYQTAQELVDQLAKLDADDDEGESGWTSPEEPPEKKVDLQRLDQILFDPLVTGSGYGRTHSAAVRRKRLVRRLGLVALLLCIVAACLTFVFSVVMTTNAKHPLSQLPKGRYQGVLTLAKSQNPLNIFLWNTEAGPYLLVGMSGCGISVLTIDAPIPCVSDSFISAVPSEIKAEEVEGILLNARHSEVGTWSLRKVE